MENKNTNTVLRVIVVGGILAILIFLSIGIVRIVPQALNTLASASVSIGSIFKTGTSTPAATNNSTSTINNYPTGPSSTLSTGTSTSGFIISTSTPSNTNNGGSTYPTNPNGTQTYGGTPDLAVTILSQGTYNTAGQYVETNSFTTGDTVVVKFKVENRGNGPSGKWSMQVTMPSQNNVDQVRNLTNETSIPPGSAVTGSAVFTDPTVGNPSVTFVVDPNHLTADTDTANNTASTQLTVVQGSNTAPGSGTTYPNTGTQPTLTFRVISTGVLDASGNFIPTSVITSSERAAVKFEVANTGSNPTGSWNLQATLTGNTSRSTASAEGSIPGNTAVDYVIGFDNLTPGSETLSLYGNGSYVDGTANNSTITSFNVTY